jgi:hypothetical protein
MKTQDRTHQTGKNSILILCGLVEILFSGFLRKSGTTNDLLFAAIRCSPNDLGISDSCGSIANAPRLGDTIGVSLSGLADHLLPRKRGLGAGRSIGSGSSSIPRPFTLRIVRIPL